MVVCKFFQQGSCRYGQNCKFEHVYASKYSYHSNAAPQAAPATPAVTDEQLINQVHADVQAVLRGGQWILSSYAPFKKPAFPGLTDLSPEEARLIIYEAKANNTLDQAIAYMNELFKDARTKYEQLLLKNTNITRVFRSLYMGENVASPFESMSHDNNSMFNSSASSVFRSAVQTGPFAQTNQTPSIFSQNNATPSVFVQNNATPSIFSQNTDPAKSIFAQANQSSFNSNQNFYPNNESIFGPQTNSEAKSIFAQASTHNAFVSAPNPVPTDPANLFASASQSVFAQNQQNTPFSNQNNIFQTPDTHNAFQLQQNVFQQASGDASYYSKMEDLSPEDLEAFNSNDFKMGFVPELPPPHSLCF